MVNDKIGHEPGDAFSVRDELHKTILNSIRYHNSLVHFMLNILCIGLV